MAPNADTLVLTGGYSGTLYRYSGTLYSAPLEALDGGWPRRRPVEVGGQWCLEGPEASGRASLPFYPLINI